MAYVLVATRIPSEQAEYLDLLIEKGIAKHRADAIRCIIEERMRADKERERLGKDDVPLPEVQKREYVAPPKIPKGPYRWGSQPKFVMYHSPNKANRPESSGMTANQLAEAFEKEYYERYGVPPVAIRTEIIESDEGLTMKASEEKGLEASEDAQFVEEIPTVRIESVPRESEDSPRIVKVSYPPIYGGSSEDPEKIGDDSEEDPSGDPSEIGEESEGIPSEIIPEEPVKEASEDSPILDQKPIIPEASGEDGEAEPPPVLPQAPSFPSPGPFGLRAEPDLSGWSEEEIREYRKKFPSNRER